MRALSALLVAACLSGQELRPPVALPVTPRLNLPKRPLTPQEMLQAMVAQDQARRAQPGVTVEVIGYDDEATLKLLSLAVAKKARLEFKITDKLQHRELYAFMQQDPSRPPAMPKVP